MHKSRYVAVLLVAVFLSCFEALASNLSKIQTSGDPTYPTGGRFYGYVSSSTGPGDQAFAKILALAKEKHAPFIIVYGKDNCPTCNSFVDNMETWSRASGQMMSYGSSLNGYFRGNASGTGPKACMDAFDFLKTKLGASGTCHIMACYGLCEDGTEYMVASSLATSYEGFGKWKISQCDIFNELAKKHKYTPPAASAGFAVKDGDLKATVETEEVYVPFIRTNSFDKAEKNWLEVTYPDGTIATNDFSWARGDTAGDVGVEVAGKLANIGDKVTLVLLNTNHLAVATNSITCAAKPANSAAFPYLPYAIDEPVFGEWTVDASFIESSRDDVAGKRAAVAAKLADYDVATNALTEATAEYDSATNLVAEALAASNTTYAAYSGKLDAYNLAAGAYDIATNALAAALAVSNSTYAAYTNSLAALDASVLAYDAATNSLAAALATSNTAYTAYTNAQAVAEASISTYDSATNAVATAEAQYGVESEQYQNATNTAAIAKSAMDNAVYLLDIRAGEYTTAAADVDVKQTAASDALSAIGTAEGNRDTAKSAYDTAVSDVAAKQTNAANMASALETATTERNTAKKAYDDAVSILEGRQSVADEKTTALGQAAADRDSAAGALETAESDLASAEEGFFLVVNGGIIWDDELRKFNETVFESVDFKSWCNANKVVPVYLDVAEPDTWASLFSCYTASNGNSGASFMSMNGLSQAEGVALAVLTEKYAEALELTDAPDGRLFQVALVRADGTVCGRLRPQYNADGTCDLNENMARLAELVGLAADLAEAANDSLPDDLPTIGFNAVDGVSATLSVNDTIDWYKLDGDFVGKEVAIAVVGTGAGEEKPAITVAAGDGTVLEPAVDGVWVFDRSLADNVYIAVSAYTDASASAVKYAGASKFEYTLKATETTTGYGKVGFVLTSEAVTEGPGLTNYLVRVARTEGLTGAVSVKVSLNTTLTTAESERYEWVGDAIISWKALEAGEKTVSVGLPDDGVWYGPGDIAFDLSVVEGGAALQTSTFVLAYQDDDPAEAGKLAIFDIVPSEAGNGKRYVRAGEEVTIRVRRSEGSYGDVTGTVTAKSGSRWNASESKVWPEKSKEIDKEFKFTPPADVFTAAQTEATFAFASTNGGIVVSSVNNPFKVTVLASDAPLFDQSEVTWSGIQYTTTDTNLTAIAVPAGMTVKSLVKIAGSVPAGLKVAIVDNEIVVTGTPTAGTVSATATYWVSLVRDAGGGHVYSMPVTVTFENKALAEVNPGFTSSRSWTGLPVTNDRRLAGLLDLSVAKNGRTSARYRMVGGKTVAFSAKGLAGVDPDGTVRLKAEKNYCCGAKYVFDATLCADGSLDATIRLAGGCNEEILGVVNISAGAEPWSAGNTAARFGGDYVAAFVLGATTNENTLCFGSPTMRLRFSSESAWRRGAVTFAGTLPNGKAVSGTAYLVPTTEEAVSASIPVFASTSSDTLSAMLDVDGEGVVATQDVVPFWSHDEGGIESLSYENDYDVVGALWSWADWNWSGEKVNVNRTSGIVSGTMRLKLDENSDRLTTVTWRGVAIPGDEPLILGAYWCNASMKYDGNRKRTVRAGDSVKLLSDGE